MEVQRPWPQSSGHSLTYVRVGVGTGVVVGGIAEVVSGIDSEKVMVPWVIETDTDVDMECDSVVLAEGETLLEKLGEPPEMVLLALFETEELLEGVPKLEVRETLLLSEGDSLSEFEKEGVGEMEREGVLVLTETEREKVLVLVSAGVTVTEGESEKLGLKVLLRVGSVLTVGGCVTEGVGAGVTVTETLKLGVGVSAGVTVTEGEFESVLLKVGVLVSAGVTVTEEDLDFESLNVSVGETAVGVMVDRVAVLDGFVDVFDGSVEVLDTAVSVFVGESVTVLDGGFVRVSEGLVMVLEASVSVRVPFPTASQIGGRMTHTIKNFSSRS